MKTTPPAWQFYCKLRNKTAKLAPHFIEALCIWLGLGCCVNKFTDYKLLLANLKVTFKFVGVVWIAISASILIGCVSDGDYSNIYDPIYFLSFAPFIAIATFAYTNLKNSHINKFVCSILFAGIGALLMNVFYFLGNFAESEEINTRVILFISCIVFGVLSMLYLQLPWKEEDA